MQKVTGCLNAGVGAIEIESERDAGLVVAALRQAADSGCGKSKSILDNGFSADTKRFAIDGAEVDAVVDALGSFGKDPNLGRRRIRRVENLIGKIVIADQLIKPK